MNLFLGSFFSSTKREFSSAKRESSVFSKLTLEDGNKATRQFLLKLLLDWQISAVDYWELTRNPFFSVRQVGEFVLAGAECNNVFTGMDLNEALKAAFKWAWEHREEIAQLIILLLAAA